MDISIIKRIAHPPIIRLLSPMSQSRLLNLPVEFHEFEVKHRIMARCRSVIAPGTFKRGSVLQTSDDNLSLNSNQIYCNTALFRATAMPMKTKPGVNKF